VKGVVFVFVFSCKTTKKQLVSLVLCAVLLIGLLSAALWRENSVSAAKVTTDDKGVAYLKDCGYTAIDGKLQEIQVPDTVDDTLTAFAKAAGLDITPLLGKRIQCRTYTVTDHPDGAAVAHLYLYKDNIIAGTITVNGKLHPLLKDVNNGTAG